MIPVHYNLLGPVGVVCLAVAVGLLFGPLGLILFGVGCLLTDALT